MRARSAKLEVREQEQPDFENKTPVHATPRQKERETKKERGDTHQITSATSQNQRQTTSQSRGSVKGVIVHGAVDCKCVDCDARVSVPV